MPDLPAMDPTAEVAPPGQETPDASGGMGMPSFDTGLDEEIEEEESSVMEHIPLASTQKSSSESISIPLDQLMEEIETL